MNCVSDSPLTLPEAQRIAESIVGNVEWQGSQGCCSCPGAAQHTTADSPTHCKVVCEPTATSTGTLAPGVYCFHSSCKPDVDAASFTLRSELGKRTRFNAVTTRPRMVVPCKSLPPTFDLAKLEWIARKLDGADAAWFAARSPKRVDNRTPASFLHELYKPGEKVIVFDTFKSQGQALWTHDGFPYDARELDFFRTGKTHGVWFLAAPVSGEYVENGCKRDGSPHLSRRSGRTVTSWRYLLLESDKANPEHWLSVLAQMPLPISAIYTSGRRSIHALVRLDATTKAEWDEYAAKLKPMMTVLGADNGAISGVRLTRLPCCERVETGKIQTLLYLNGTPDDTPIADQSVTATCGSMRNGNPVEEVEHV